MKKLVLFSVVPVIAVVIGIVAYQRVLEERRHTLFGVLENLRPGMPRQEVMGVIARHEAAFLQKHDEPDKVILVAPLGGGRSCILTMRFSGDTLAAARIRGENGPGDRFPDAPGDISG